MQLSVQEMSALFQELPQIRDAVEKKAQANQEEERARRKDLIAAVNAAAAEIAHLEKNLEVSQQEFDATLRMVDEKRTLLFVAGHHLKEAQMRLGALNKQIDAAGERERKHAAYLVSSRIAGIDKDLHGLRRYMADQGKSSYMSRMMNDGPLAAASAENRLSESKEKVKALEQARKKLVSLEAQVNGLELAPISPAEMRERCVALEKAIEAICADEI